MASSLASGKRPLSTKSDLSVGISIHEDIMMSSLPTSQAESDSEHRHLLENSGRNVDEDSNQQKSQHHMSSTAMNANRQRFKTIKTWWQEFALSLLTVALLIAIISILAAFNGKPIPKWTIGLNLNTVVALLATLIRSSLAMVIEEVLSQAKWVWQRSARTVTDLVAFDEASRGPLGSSLLWFRVAASNNQSKRSFVSLFAHSQFHPAFLASTVGILSLAIGAFTQQAIKSVPCVIEVPGANVSIPLVYGNLGGMTVRFGASMYDLDFATKGRLFRAFTGSGTERQSLVQGCATGNCTFEEIAPGVTYSTSGFCSKCLNTASKVTEITEVQRPQGLHETYYVKMLRLPSELGVGPLVTYPDYVLRTSRGNTTWLATDLDNKPDYFKAFNSSAATLHILALSTAGCDWSVSRNGQYVGDVFDCLYPLGRNTWNRSRKESTLSWNVAAASCALYPCIQDVKAEVKNGILHEIKVKDDPIYPIDLSFEGDVGMFRSPCFVDGVRYDKPASSSAKPPSTSNQDASKETSSMPAKCYYSLPRWIFFTMLLQDWFDNLLVGNCSMATNSGDDAHIRSSALCGTSWWLSGLYNRGNATFENISTIMDDVATALTDSLRLGSIAEYGMNINNTVNGTVWKSDVCTEFNWRWLLFPATLIILTLISLVLIMVATAFDSNTTPVWKSSILPFLYLARLEASTVLRSDSLQEMEKAAREEQVVLKHDDRDRWQLLRTKKDI